MQKLLFWLILTQRLTGASEKLTIKNPITKIYVHGYEPDLNKIFGDDNNEEEEKRILFAPLRYGAGIKGKIVDAWTYNMPVVTIPIGSEGMTIEVVKSTTSTISTSQYQ